LLHTNGIRLAYETAGRGDEALVLLHPFCLDRRALAPVVERLAASHRIYALDLRGHGESEVPVAPYSMAELADDVIGAIDALGLSRVNLAGLALGACTAMHVAGRIPERIVKLGLVAGHAVTPPETAPIWDERIATVRRDGVSALAGMTVDRWYGATASSLSDAARRELIGWISAMPVEGYAGAGAALRGHDARQALGCVVAPTLVVAGDSDLAAPPARSREIAAMIPDARLAVIERCGHIASLQQPEALAALLSDFLRG
jgi:3-oxoadipate enol-lactonase